jgi:hypothetical protein
MHVITMGSQGQIQLPEELCQLASFVEGDVLEVLNTDDGVLLRAVEIPDADAAWFWTTQWQAGEKEADCDRLAGHLTTFATGADFVAALDQLRTP